MPNNSDLDRLLKKAALPATTGEYWDDFSGRAIRRLRQSSSQEFTRLRRTARLAWGIAALACVGCALLMFWRKPAPQSGDSFLQNKKAIEETLAMFPNRVRAIVIDEHGLNLVLSDKNDVPDSTPLWIRMCDGKHCASVVTFSGQNIDLAGRQLTALSNPRGDVMLVGKDFIWSSVPAESTGGGNLRVEARVL